jgi:hypothetical protein
MTGAIRCTGGSGRCSAPGNSTAPWRLPTCYSKERAPLPLPMWHAHMSSIKTCGRGRGSMLRRFAAPSSVYKLPRAIATTRTVSRGSTTVRSRRGRPGLIALRWHPHWLMIIVRRTGSPCTGLPRLHTRCLPRGALGAALTEFTSMTDETSKTEAKQHINSEG